MTRVVHGRVHNGVVIVDGDALVEGAEVTVVVDAPPDRSQPDLWHEIGETARLVRELRSQVVTRGLAMVEVQAERKTGSPPAVGSKLPRSRRG